MILKGYINGRICVLPLVMMGLTLGGCSRYNVVAVRGSDIGLDCDSDYFADRQEYYLCVQAREAVRTNELVELSVGDPN